MEEKHLIHTKIIAIVVLYKCPPENCDSLITLNSSCRTLGITIDVIIYDNYPTRNGIKQHHFPNLNIVCYRKDSTNPGVSAPYNFANRFASDNNKKWLLLLDQDSNLPLNFMSILIEGIHKNPKIRIFAPIVKSQQQKILSPARHRLEWSFTSKRVTPGINSFRNLTLINSGTLFDTTLIEEIGGFHPSLPLDFSDTYLINKIRKIGYDFFLIDNVIQHSLSNEETDLGKIKVRYKIYIRSSRIYRKYVNRPYLFTGGIVLRALKLSWKHRDLFFISELLRK